MSSQVEAFIGRKANIRSLSAAAAYAPARRLVTALPLADFPYFRYFTDSLCNGSIGSYAKTSLENRITNHRNTESHAAPAQERRRAHPRVPDRARGRAAHRGLSGQSPAAPRPNDDPARFQARAAGFRGLRPAMDPG